jgi:hypothetical protein
VGECRCYLIEPFFFHDGEFFQKAIYATTHSRISHRIISNIVRYAVVVVVRYTDCDHFENEHNKSNKECLGKKHILYN